MRGQGIDGFDVEAAMRLSIDQGRGRAGAQPQAINRLQRHRAISPRRTEIDAESMSRVLRAVLAAHGQAGFGAAELYV